MRADRLRTTTAVERAGKVWGEAALYARHELRRKGCHKDLRHLDDIASGRRGSAVPRGLTAFAKELRDAGEPLDVTRARLQDAAAMIAALVYADQSDPSRSA